MTSENELKSEQKAIVDEVDRLSDEVKSLAVDLALILAKVKSNKDDGKLITMEADFMRLINGSVKVVREVAIILNAAQNKETMVWEAPSGKMTKDQIEVKLNGVLEQCNRVLDSLAEIKNWVG